MAMYKWAAGACGDTEDVRSLELELQVLKSCLCECWEANSGVLSTAEDGMSYYIPNNIDEKKVK